KTHSRSRSREKRRSRSHEKRFSEYERDFRASIREKERFRERRSPVRRSPSPPSYTRGGKPGEGMASGKKLPGPERRDVNLPEQDLSPEERDARTVRDVRIITDSKTRRSKGIAYVEFWDLEAVPLALGLHGQRLLGAPIVVQPTQSEKNRMASAMLATAFGQNRGPMKLYVGSLHFNISEDMLRGIFDPFGKIDSIQLLKDPESGRSRGYGFITFHNAEDAKRAMEQLNGFELAGRPIKVGHVTEHQPSLLQPSLDSDELDRTGIDLGTTGRLQLMAKLAEGMFFYILALLFPFKLFFCFQGTGMELPQVAQQILNQPSGAGSSTGTSTSSSSIPPIATQCFMLSNMFDPTQETEPNWDRDIMDDVIEECNKEGGTVHIFVDRASPQGNVYVKCPSVTSAVAAVNSLHGRWFAGKIITANYVPVANYHQLFPESVNAVKLLQPSFKST
uniref:RNA-binding protein 39 n=1 Tax=Soboliphyme baturini TaxID=241478 RepID=A0A183IUK1_9BILA